MAKAKPCRTCGHSKGEHTSRVGRCDFRYHLRDGAPVSSEKWYDTDGFGPRQYRCLCQGWLPEEKRRYDKETDRVIFLGYEDGLGPNGEKLNRTEQSILVATMNGEA